MKARGGIDFLAKENYKSMALLRVIFYSLLCLATTFHFDEIAPLTGLILGIIGLFQSLRK